MGNMTTVPAPTQSRRAFGLVRTLLLNGSFGPGEWLSEPKLCDQLGISRTPIRAALTQLEFEGLLERRDIGGFQVRQFSVTDVEDTVKTRASLEALAVRLAIYRGVEPGLLLKARELLSCMDAVLNGAKLDAFSLNTYAARNRAFHALLAEMSGSA
jgi:GntR family transcriptional regulator of vanillate catabolism